MLCKIRRKENKIIAVSLMCNLCVCYGGESCDWNHTYVKGYTITCKWMAGGKLYTKQHRKSAWMGRNPIEQ